jgi:membrane-associated phospholipid phosphatase
MILLESDSHSGLLKQILHTDRWLFTRINQDWTSSFADSVFPFLREAELWTPFYLFLWVFITVNFRKKGWFWALSLIMTAIISDLISSSIIKNLVIRTRPCRDLSLIDSIRFLVNYCPSSSSFVSSHACNHFAIATFIYLTLRSTSRWWVLIFVWAALISYAQVYVGVHYPGDIICGAILGSLIGLTTSRVFRLQFGTLHLQSYNHSHA